MALIYLPPFRPDQPPMRGLLLMQTKRVGWCRKCQNFRRVTASFTHTKITLGKLSVVTPPPSKNKTNKKTKTKKEKKSRLVSEVSVLACHLKHLSELQLPLPHQIVREIRCARGWLASTRLRKAESEEEELEGEKMDRRDGRVVY